VRQLRRKSESYRPGIGISPRQRREEKEREELKAVFSQLFAEEIRSPVAYLVLREVVERVFKEREAKAKQEVARRKRKRKEKQDAKTPVSNS